LLRGATAKAEKLSLWLDQSCRPQKVVTPNSNIEPDGGMTPLAEFTYNGHKVEIVPPDTEHLIGNFWQIKIDGVLQHDLLFSSLRVAADQAKKLIDQERRTD
jgi:hypothetical protein